MLVYVKMILKRKKREEEFLKAETGKNSLFENLTFYIFFRAKEVKV